MTQSNRLLIADALAEALAHSKTALDAEMARMTLAEYEEYCGKNHQKALDLVSAAITLGELGGNRFRERHLHKAVKQKYGIQWPLPWDWTDVFVKELGCVRCLEDGSFEWVEPRKTWTIKQLWP